MQSVEPLDFRNFQRKVAVKSGIYSDCLPGMRQRAALFGILSEQPSKCDLPCRKIRMRVMYVSIPITTSKYSPKAPTCLHDPTLRRDVHMCYVTLVDRAYLWIRRPPVGIPDPCSCTAERQNRQPISASISPPSQSRFSS